MRHDLRRSTPLAALIALCATMVLPPAVMAQGDADDAARLVTYLELGPGMTVAEIGAGTGELSVSIARTVGPSGTVFSNELDTARHSSIRAAAERAGLSNLTVVEGRPFETNLPDGCCDAIFMRDVYHHFDDAARMNQSLYRSLAPGGRIAIIDFPPRGNRGSNGHGIAIETVKQDLAAAGFEIVHDEEQRGGRWFMVVGTKR